MAKNARPPALAGPLVSIALISIFLVSIVAAATGCGSAHNRAAGHNGSVGHRVAGPSLQTLAAEYMRIARPANHRLDVEVEAYADHVHGDLAAAEAALRAEAATERRFDRELARIKFPPPIAATARALIAVNQIRAAMTERQARVSSSTKLIALTGSHKAADAEVEAQVRVIRAQLGLPPPSSS